MTLPRSATIRSAPPPDGFALRARAALDPLAAALTSLRPDGDDRRRPGRRASRSQLGDRRVELRRSTEEDGWWFLQDRLTIRGERDAAPRRPRRRGRRSASSSRTCRVGPDGPLTLPFHIARSLMLDAPPQLPASVVRGSAVRPAERRDPALPAGWMLAASRLQLDTRGDPRRPGCGRHRGRDRRGRRRLGHRAEPGQLWRSFPEPDDADVDAFGERLAAAGGSRQHRGREPRRLVSPHGTRRTDAERLAFLAAAAARRAPRRARRACACRSDRRASRCCDALLPILHELDLVLFEEIQGQQTPDSPGDGRGDRHDRAASTTRTCACSWTSPCSCRRCRRAISQRLRGRRGARGTARVASATEWRDPATWARCRSAALGRRCRRRCTRCT